MQAIFPAVEVGDPIKVNGLSVFPLFHRAESSLDYVLSEEAMGKDSVSVEEVSEAGSVNNLRVENRGDRSVLFLEGEELIGAKQNRVLNTSVLVAADTKISLPVSCVESHRWNYTSRKFRSGSHSPSSLRHILKKSVSRSLQANCGHRSEQAAVWQEVDRKLLMLGVSAETRNMSDILDRHRDKVEDVLSQLGYVAGARGLAVALGGTFVFLDLLDSAATCQKLWNRLMIGFAMDSLEVHPTDKQADKAGMQSVLACLNQLPWQQAEPVGEGVEWRAEGPDGMLASALAVNGTLVHGSVSVSAAS